MNTTQKFAAAEGKFITVNGRRLWVEEHGTGEPIILLPGGPAASHLIFQPYFNSLAEKYRIIYYDYFGRGKSDKPADYSTITFQDDVNDLDSLREALQLDTVNLYGFSYGGMVAQQYSLQFGQHVKKLILANTLHSPEMWQRNHENINREISNQYPELWDDILSLKKNGARSSEPAMREVFAAAKQNLLVRFYNPENAVELMDGKWMPNLDLYFEFTGHDIDFFIGGQLMHLPDFRLLLHSLKMPVMILAGRYDRALYPRCQMEFKTACPQATFIMFEKSGSFIHIEENEKLLTTVDKFLR